MQSTDSLKPTEFWWPSPEAFDDLIVEDSEEGFILDAPDSTECGDWLAYWNQSLNHIELFTEEFTKVLTNHANTTLEQHGQTKEFTDGLHEDGFKTEDVSPRSQP